MISSDKIRYMVSVLNIVLDYPMENNENLLRTVANILPPLTTTPDVTASELKIFISQGKIPAIKEYRTRTNSGLKEAKDAIEAAANSLGLVAYNGPLWT